jgi:hypothetical protein
VRAEARLSGWQPVELVVEELVTEQQRLRAIVLGDEVVCSSQTEGAGMPTQYAGAKIPLDDWRNAGGRPCGTCS